VALPHRLRQPAKVHRKLQHRILLLHDEDQHLQLSGNPSPVLKSFSKSENSALYISQVASSELVTDLTTGLGTTQTLFVCKSISYKSAMTAWLGGPPRGVKNRVRIPPKTNSNPVVYECIQNYVLQRFEKVKFKIG
jgi:hypothetical protein